MRAGGIPGRGADVSTVWVGCSQDGQGETLTKVGVPAWLELRRPRSKDVKVQ